MPFTMKSRVTPYSFSAVTSLRTAPLRFHSPYSAISDLSPSSPRRIDSTTPPKYDFTLRSFDGRYGKQQHRYVSPPTDSGREPLPNKNGPTRGHRSHRREGSAQSAHRSAVGSRKKR